ncbi:chorismate mutase [Novosphingobium sp. 9U]|uniref:chorismate mutase n=1 Tax=Novosphingobium sp. 9U TaxID=2653158 RepID=UPI0012F2A6FE|nr:chorismate mutase [Novosphingobium sp. 9U]VWX52125.1 Isochorismate pyruvate-lyase [Novosphingobium sp. 9U]
MSSFTSDTTLPPDACQSMREVRAAIDALDNQLVDMLATRFAYMRAAARIKPDRGHVRDEGRKAEVIANAKARAEALDLPVEAIGAIWEGLVEASIAYELDHWDKRRQD